MSETDDNTPEPLPPETGDKKILRFDLWRKRGRGGVAFGKLKQDIGERGIELETDSSGRLIAPKGRENSRWFQSASEGQRFRDRVVRFIHSLNPRKK